MDYVKVIKNSNKLYKKIKAFKEKENDEDNVYYYFDNEKNTITDTNKLDKKEKPESFEKFIDYKIDEIMGIVNLPLNEQNTKTLIKFIEKEVKEKMTVQVKNFFKENKNKVLEGDLEDEIKSIKKQVDKHYARLSGDIESYASSYVSELNNSLKLH